MSFTGIPEKGNTRENKLINKPRHEFSDSRKIPKKDLDMKFNKNKN